MNDGIVLASKQIQLVEPTFDDDPMVNADSVVCTLTGTQGVISTTDMIYTDDLDKTDTWGWYANINAPAVAQVVKVQVEAVKGGARGRWRTKLTIKRF